MQNPIILTEYDYKGQRWFAFARDGSSPDSDLSDRTTHTTFYNTDCKIVCSWTKEGTGGSNKITPDSVQKERIKKIRIVTSETTQYQNTKRENVLPDTIAALAHSKNCRWIEQRSHKGEYLYRFQDVRNDLSTSQVTFTDRIIITKAKLFFIRKSLESPIGGIFTTMHLSELTFNQDLNNTPSETRNRSKF